MAQPRISLIVCCVVLLPDTIQSAGPFLEKGDAKDLLTDVEAALGLGNIRGHVEKLEARIRPMFVALPKNNRNLASHAAARYALHRINMDLHGWSIEGLEPNETTFNTTSLVGSGILRNLLPNHLETLFSSRVSDGFGIRDLAILASVIEHLVHEDQKRILLAACEALDLPTTGPMGSENMQKIIQLYMTLFLKSWPASLLKPHNANRILAAMHSYPGWPETILLIDDERETLTHVEKDRANPFIDRASDLQSALRVVGQIADHFTRNQADPECREMKDDLLVYESGDTGRVPLADFYRADFDSRFFFLETREYLRAVGALDESNSAQPKVIVPNFILAKSNCLADSRIYAVCCTNECEGLIGHVEQEIAAPYASPERIIEVVANISSSTVQAPRNLSQTLWRYLHEIASEHKGSVLLHGRLFAHWMHRAFPRECPYPHITGTTTSLNPQDWADQTGIHYRIDAGTPREQRRNASLSVIEAIEQACQTSDANSTENDADQNLMWTLEEEHFATPSYSAPVMDIAFKLCVVMLFILGLTAAWTTKKLGKSDTIGTKADIFV